MGIGVGIVGHRGYSGAELVRILRRHPGISPVLLEHRQDAVDANTDEAIPGALAIHFLYPGSREISGSAGGIACNACGSVTGLDAGYVGRGSQSCRPQRRIPAKDP